MVWITSNDEESLAIQELTTVEDRTAAITAGTILEGRLESAIKLTLHHDEDITNEMFRETGPFGAFGSKIRLGFMLGLYTIEAQKDLRCISKIRNQFAHKLRAKSFSVNEIKTNCSNLKLVDKHVFEQTKEVEPMGVDVTTWQRFYVKDRDKELADPKMRFLISVMIITTMLTTPPT